MRVRVGTSDLLGCLSLHEVNRLKRKLVLLQENESDENESDEDDEIKF